MNRTVTAPRTAGDRFVVCDVALFYAERSGGIRTYLNEKARFAVRTGAFEHHLVVPGKCERHVSGRHELRSLQLAASNGYRLPLGGRPLRETLRAIRPDVVILHDPFWRPLRVTREAHRLGAAVVAVHHASPALNAAGLPGPDALYLPALKRIYQHAYEHVDAVMSTVDPEPDCGRSAAIKLRFGLDPAFRPGPAVNGDELLYVGRVSLEKRISDILDAMALARWGRPLRIVGDGPARPLVESRARRLGLGGLLELAALRVGSARARQAVPRGGLRGRAWPARDVWPGRARGGGERCTGSRLLLDSGHGGGRSARPYVPAQGFRRPRACRRRGAGAAARCRRGVGSRRIDGMGTGVRGGAARFATPLRLRTNPIEARRVTRLRAEAHRVLAGNWRSGALADGTPYGFTCPSPPRYRHQWYWDSCFHAIVWRHFEPARAREELRTLVRGGRLDGFIPHTIFWHDRAGWRRAPFYATHSLRGNRATAHIQTPLLALAWEYVAAASPEEPAFRTEALDALRLHYDWLERHRDPDGDGLISIIHPDESGLDDSPKYDAVFGWMSHYLPGYVWLVERSRRLRYDSRAIIARYEEHVEDVLVNVFYALSLYALARLTGEEHYARRAARTEGALLEHCWDEERGLFWDLAGRDHSPQRVSTWSSLAPLALPSLPEPIARRLIEEHLVDPRRYGAPYAIPSVSMEEPSFRAGWHLFRCWRGPAWINTVWLLAPALRRLGYTEAADRLLHTCVELVERHGFREYYNPLTGEGLAAHRFGWSTLLVDLLPPADGAPAETAAAPFAGSVPAEVWSMGAEAASETRRLASARLADVVTRLRGR